MPNRFTSVPDAPVPPLRGWPAVLLPVADLFMEVMLSRPPSGTLRTTWVTPGTLQLCGALVVLGGVFGLLVGAYGLAMGAWLLAAAALLLLLLTAGAAAVAVVGLAQRRTGNDLR